jgi:hypothetical protein
MNEALINPEVFTLASQLYVRMRRSGRVVDAVYMAQNTDYAHEILRIAARETDVDILDIVTRFEALLAREVEKTKVEPLPVLTHAAVVAMPTIEQEREINFNATLPPTSAAALKAPSLLERVVNFNATLPHVLPVKQPTLPTIPVEALPAHQAELEEEVAHHYIGALR